MKNFSAPAMAEIEAGTAGVSAAVEIASDPPIRLWGGLGTIQIGGEDFLGIGDRGLAQVSGGAVGGAEQNVTLELSGVEAEAVEVLEADEVQGAPVTVWRLVFKGDHKTLLDAQVFTRGRLDQLPLEDVVGGTALIRALVESAARGLGRRGGRMRTEADQRLVDALDGFFKSVSFAGQKTLAWGGKRPAAASSVLPGAMPSVGVSAGGMGQVQRV